MRNKKYPRIGEIIGKPKNTQAKCRCGYTGKYKVHIQYDCMRGNDDVVWACYEHKHDCEYLVSGYKV